MSTAARVRVPGRFASVASLPLKKKKTSGHSEREALARRAARRRHVCLVLLDPSCLKVGCTLIRMPAGFLVPNTCIVAQLWVQVQHLGQAGRIPEALKRAHEVRSNTLLLLLQKAKLLATGSRWRAEASRP